QPRGRQQVGGHRHAQARDRLAVDGHNLVAGRDAGLLGDAADLDRPDPQPRGRIGLGLLVGLLGLEIGARRTRTLGPGGLAPAHLQGATLIFGDLLALHALDVAEPASPASGSRNSIVPLPGATLLTSKRPSRSVVGPCPVNMPRPAPGSMRPALMTMIRSPAIGSPSLSPITRPRKVP